MDADLGDFLQKSTKTDHLFIDHLAIYNVKRVASTKHACTEPKWFC